MDIILRGDHDVGMVGFPSGPILSPKNTVMPFAYKAPDCIVHDEGEESVPRQLKKKRSATSILCFTNKVQKTQWNPM